MSRNLNELQSDSLSPGQSTYFYDDGDDSWEWTSSMMEEEGERTTYFLKQV